MFDLSFMTAENMEMVLLALITIVGISIILIMVFVSEMCGKAEKEIEGHTALIEKLAKEKQEKVVVPEAALEATVPLALPTAKKDEEM